MVESFLCQCHPFALRPDGNTFESTLGTLDFQLTKVLCGQLMQLVQE